MNITFKPLKKSDFPLLLKWLKTPYIKEWWDQDIIWVLYLIKKRYEDYTKGFKVLILKDGTKIKKPINAFIIAYNNTAIGYIQYYNKHDFPSHHGYESKNLPPSCAGVDFYIGELEFTGRGIGTKTLKLFLENHVFPKYDHAFTDPEKNNVAAIRCYEKAGFITKRKIGNVLWMLKSNPLI